MRILAAVGLMAATMLATPAMAQQVNQSTQTEADKGIKTQNSGAAGFVEDQDKAGAAAQAPGQPNKANPAGQSTVGSNPSTQQRDPAHVQGMPGNKSGPPAKR